MENKKFHYTPLESPVPITEQCWPDGTLPLVYARINAYMHEKFIRKCIEGILMQKTTFPVIVLIHDDASTDSTPDIIREYESKFPNLIKAYYQKENSYSQKNFRDRWVMIAPFEKWFVGKYEAKCEGDDYWMDPLKLQKQITILEQNPDVSLCVGGYKRTIFETDETSDVILRIKPDSNLLNGFFFSLDDMKKDWITTLLTAVIRKSTLDKHDLTHYNYFRDIHIFYHIMKGSKGFYLTELLGVYNVHDQGINSMRKEGYVYRVTFESYKELFEHNKDEFTRHMCFKSAMTLLCHGLYHEYEGNTFKSRLSVLFYGITLIRSPRDVMTLVFSFFPSSMKQRIRNRIYSA